MKILLAPLLLAVSLPAFAEVDSKIHKLCIEAKDYSGCVRSMKGETSTETTVNQIQRQGANLTEGNICPAQHLYSGGGYCQRVVCIKAGLWGRGHDEGLGGKGSSCTGGAEMRWDNNHQPVRASFTNNCPSVELQLGYNSTCTMPVKQTYTKKDNYAGRNVKIDSKYILGGSCIVRPRGCKTFNCLKKLPPEACTK